MQDILAIDIDSPTSLTIHLSQPVAGAFYPLLAGQESFIVAPSQLRGAEAAINEAPIGAGAFRLKQYVPNQEIQLVRNPRYWDAKDIHLKELDLVNAQAGAQSVNALESGLADVAQIPLADLRAVQSTSAYHITVISSQTQKLWMPTCKLTGPLSNAQVRQALNFAIDRRAINDAVLDGKGEPEWALWPKSSIYFPESLNDYYAFNLRKARRLLVTAGYRSGFHVGLIIGPGDPTVEKTAEIIQAEWRQIGVEANIISDPNATTDAYIRHTAPLYLISSSRGGLASINGPYRPGDIGDMCNYDSPHLDAMLNQLDMLTPGTPKDVSIWKAAQEFVTKKALAIQVDFVPVVFASTKNVRGLSFVLNPAAVPYYWGLSASSKT